MDELRRKLEMYKIFTEFLKGRFMTNTGGLYFFKLKLQLTGNSRLNQTKV